MKLHDSKLGLAQAWLLLLSVLLSTNLLAKGQENEPIKRGWDFAGFPLLNFTTDRGVGYGAYLATFYHGSHGSGDAPYRASIGGQFYQTTGGYAFHKLLLDLPNLAGTGMRLDFSSGYETWDRAWYFGLGNRTPRLKPSQTPERYYEFDLKNLWFVPNLRIPIKGSWQIFTGLVLRSAQVGMYQNSLLSMTQPIGSQGGFLNQLQLGLLYDSRDQEPSTSRGIFTEGSIRGAHGFIGSDFNTWGANLTHRQWFSLISANRLVLALRTGLDLYRGEVPFFHQHILGGSQWVEIGGNLALRGLPNGRHRGHVTAYSNLELRWLCATFSPGSAQLDTLLVPFLDLGRVWLWGENDDFFHLHGSVGTSFRLVYNKVFVVRFDVAYALEEYAQQPAQTEISERQGVFGVYAIVNHPF